MKFHICADKVRHRCSDDTCSKGHTLQTPHNRSLLQIYDTPENAMYMMLIVKINKGNIAEDRRRSRWKENTKTHEQEGNLVIGTICSGPFLEEFLKKHNGYCNLLEFMEIRKPPLLFPRGIFQHPSMEKILLHLFST